MKIIISPAKKMNLCDDVMNTDQRPVFQEEMEVLYHCLMQMSYEELKTLWCCNDKIAQLNYERLKNWESVRRNTPALLAYEGIQYQYMAPQVFTNKQWDYANHYLRIISGLYGVLRPMDGVAPYRLEMQARLHADGKHNLYEFWGDKIFRELTSGEDEILNLASKEYSKTVERYLGRYPGKSIRYISCIFGELSQSIVKVKATQAKMARGEMVRWMAETYVEDLEDVKEFTGLGYEYCPDYSTGYEYVFLK
ncbi:peroxide stress protein YaaA [Lactonifactor sp. BIOML-A3]|uniref:peroxide stress protein YaaA n=1 Tax=unclassified Lactonifactor TaxID=2636670 RepID=UPI0012AF7D32|nr:MULTISPECIES: peroxide stress protein YaaA [unclassified Lactonifactor]MSA00058.1 peroxide stress protein YaaA [Lactonifactor sp. BIOML-A5]MSA06685.1 peroxide stress protein YaaA [Lactonifactor sp. BIOML-A4]MSA10903.1 peroxide stress protein YaaA [Lactonifactor sp. BIOML-A3]MSA15917.1 peroxide stress protein YaaA [Lactonifactor sp. BIOML-A2]MSA36521.1 peroxide stress protein YaaA [Lactonifactor sp. BIOML-A1]